VPAVGIEHVDRAVLTGEDDEFLAEGLDGMGFSVPEGACQSQAVLPAREPGAQLTDIDVAHLCRAVRVAGPRHRNPSVISTLRMGRPRARTRYRNPPSAASGSGLDTNKNMF